MYRIGLQMLTQDKAKFIGLVLALSFSALIITQQAGIFFGLMMRTYSTIADTPEAAIWVMDYNVKMLDDIKPLRDTDLFRVRSVEGVEWAVPMFKGLIRARLSDGQFQTCILLGIDDATLIGGPNKLIQGNIYDLRAPDAVIVDTYELNDKLSVRRPGSTEKSPMELFDVLELNDQRAVVVGICKINRTFQTQPVIYTTYNRALLYSPYERELLSFVLAKPKSSISAESLCEKIHNTTGLLALTNKQFKDKTINYYLKNTGIPLNFGLAILLGILIGAAIAGQIFFNFTTDNLPYIAMLSVMGASKKLLAQITILQAAFVALLGWNIGAGAAALIGYLSRNSQLSFYLPPSLYFATGLIIFTICLVASMISISRIYKIDLAEVFKQ
jgi:putative ABC transport system permease protein